jgi:hypothetical protein
MSWAVATFGIKNADAAMVMALSKCRFFMESSVIIGLIDKQRDA